MTKRQPTVVGQAENGGGSSFFSDFGDKWIEAIFESSYDGIYITDGNAKTLMLNKSYETISGLSRQEMIGNRMADLVRDKVISVSGTLLALERKESVTMEQIFKTGKRAMITSTPVFDSNSNIVMVVTNVRDVTELYTLKEQLEQSEERNRQYSAELEAARIRREYAPANLIFRDKNMQDVINLLNRAAAMDVPVLLQGEVGVGKGVLSEYIHSRSSRKKESYVVVPCAYLTDDNMSGDLFGLAPGVSPKYPEGKKGLLEMANHGVVFLDEVENLNQECQTRLLNVVKRHRLQPIGYGADIPIDIRIITSTTADLLEEVHQKRFREDLYYSLNVLPIHVPPLRERREDIPYIITSFTAEMNKKYHQKRRFSPEAIICMQNYDWPGNIRELNNVVERMMIISKSSTIQMEELPIVSDTLIGPKESEEYFEQVNLHKLVDQLEISYIRKAYNRYGNVRDAARSLGMDASTFVRKRKKHEQTNP